MSNENSELDDLMSQLERYDETVLDFDDTFIWEYLINVDEPFRLRCGNRYQHLQANLPTFTLFL